MSDWIEKVHALADGELAESEKDEALLAVSSDPRASAEHQWALLFKTQLREKLVPVTDDETWKGCKARLDAIDKTRKAELFVGKYAWAFCLIFLVGIFSAATLNRMGGSRLLSNEHVAGLFNGLTPFSFAEPRQAIEGVRQNVGVAPRQVTSVAQVTSLRVGTVDGRRTANLTLYDGRGYTNLFVIADTSGIEGIDQMESGYLCGMINEAPAVSWTDSGYLFLLIGPRQHSDLLNLANQIRHGR